MLMSASDYRESLRRYKPRVFVNGQRVESVADEPLLAPGIATTAFATTLPRPRASAPDDGAPGDLGQTVNRMVHINETSTDLLNRLEAVRLVCRESGYAMRYLTHDAANRIFQATKQIEATLVDLIKIVEGFFACGVAASVYAVKDAKRHGDAGRGALQHRQAAAGDPDLRHAPAGALRLGRPGGGAARTRRGS